MGSQSESGTKRERWWVSRQKISLPGQIMDAKGKERIGKWEASEVCSNESTTPGNRQSWNLKPWINISLLCRLYWMLPSQIRKWVSDNRWKVGNHMVFVLTIAIWKKNGERKVHWNHRQDQLSIWSDIPTVLSELQPTVLPTVETHTSCRRSSVEYNG